MNTILTETRVKLRDGDYLGADGLAVCGQCGLPREGYVPGGDVIMPILCRCGEEERRDRELQRLRRDQMDRLRSMWKKDGLNDPTLLFGSFERDDGRDPEASALCRWYVERWERSGVMITGPGKTFYAGCIANELISRGVKVCFTSIRRIWNSLRTPRQATFDRLLRYDLLILDDYRTTRGFDEDIIEPRFRAGKPLIITAREEDVCERLAERLPVRINLNGGDHNGKSRT